MLYSKQKLVPLVLRGENVAENIYTIKNDNIK